MANRVAGQEVYHWQLLTMDGTPAMASNGLTLTPRCAWIMPRRRMCCLFCGGVHVRTAVKKPMLAMLRRQARQEQYVKTRSRRYTGRLSVSPAQKYSAHAAIAASADRLGPAQPVLGGAGRDRAAGVPPPVSWPRPTVPRAAPRRARPPGPLSARPLCLRRSRPAC